MSVEGPLRSGGLDGGFIHVCPDCPIRLAINASVSNRLPCHSETRQLCEAELESMQSGSTPNENTKIPSESITKV
ncbi:hypothetical protein A3D01_06405 [Candidatus Woesebacteria bacterium RIFCSPHIGHO2_02_FULL_39_13]|uniref:Uncharacterized protein n=1 Tax=Candidatus Woesebacteria bacterium RIFCSPHIGHO2_02_FULL_39_13 TaxID=1802505 RepID=A0A1F7Z3Q9_9BACT|nr:MAG: hypothetical protein A3D01_06405 [Candidatus Woesebacteria bacterium RIFCSPHIGHO2_02_FULL_39_13]OGM74766.1 MAG: hypothetical protein A3H19_00310 [Candidatus Woesebacteria bacterium RIFCSPLOWO2_12_FULL_39_9]